MSESGFRITKAGRKTRRKRGCRDQSSYSHMLLLWTSASGLWFSLFPWFVLPFFEFSLRSRGRDASTAWMRSMGESRARDWKEDCMHEAKQSDSREECVVSWFCCSISQLQLPLLPLPSSPSSPLVSLACVELCCAILCACYFVVLRLVFTSLWTHSFSLRSFMCSY